jgi:hypothetical protein
MPLLKRRSRWKTNGETLAAKPDNLDIVSTLSTVNHDRVMVKSGWRSGYMFYVDGYLH